MATPATIPMFDPTGQVRDIPADQADAAKSAGGQPALRFLDPTGKERWVPESQRDQALAAGGRWIEHKPQPAAAAPDWRDKVISHLSRPRETPPPDTRSAADLGLPDSATVEDVARARRLSPLGENPVAYTTRKALGSAAAMILHPVDTARGLAQQVGDVASYPAALLVDENAPETKTNATAQMLLESKHRLEGQVKDLAHQAVTDPEGFIGEQAGQAAVMHGAARGAGATVEAVKRGVKSAGRATASSLLNVTPRDTEALVRETADKNVAAQEAADAANAKIQSTNADTQAAHAESLRRHAAKIDQVQAENARRETAYQQRVEEAQRSREESVQASQQAAADAESAETSRADLARQEITLRNRIAQRVQSIRASAKATLDNTFNGIRAAIADPAASAERLSREQFDKSYSDLTPDERAVVDANNKPGHLLLQPLVEAVTRAENSDLKGSSNNVKVFNDIISRAEGEGKQLSFKDDITRSNNWGNSYDELDADKKAAVDKVADQMSQQYDESRMSDSGQATTISFDHLRGYSSELGKALRSGTLDGDVYRAVKNVKTTVDAMAQQLANESGVGAKLRRARRQWATYLDTFAEATGPSGSGSPVAQSINAEDAFHATEPFLDKQPEVASRARKMLVGDKLGATAHYDPNAGKLIDQLREIKRQQARLPRASKTATAIAAGAEPLPPVPVPEGTAMVGGEPGAAMQQAAAAAGQTGQTAAPAQQVMPRRAGELPKPAPEPPIAPKLKPEVAAELTDLTPERLESIRRTKLLDELTSMRSFTRTQIAQIAGGAVSLAAGLGSIMAHFGNPLAAGAEIGVGTFALGRAVYPHIVAKLLESDRVINALAKPTLRDFEAVKAMPAEQRTGVEQAIRDLTDQAKRAGKIKSSPWISFFDHVLKPLAPAASVGRQSVQQQDREQAATEAAKRAADYDKMQQEIDDLEAQPQ